MSTEQTDFDYDPATVPRGALFVAADEPLLVYPSVAAAQYHLEAIDAESGVYPAAFGPHGEPFRVGSDGKRVIIEATGEPNRPDELRLLLERYLEAIGRAPEAAATFDELVATVWRVESEFWQENDPYGDRFAKPVPGWCCLAGLLVPAALLFALLPTFRVLLVGIVIAALILWPVSVLAKRRAGKADNWTR